MDQSGERSVIAFAGKKCVAEGNISEVALQIKTLINNENDPPVLIFDAASGEPVEVDLRGSAEDVLQRLPGNEGTGQGEGVAAPRSPGRPRLGVVAREVTLLPRHWDWLRAQPGGASVALRKLVEHASRANRDQDRIRRAQEACYRFMAAMAGNLPGFEEAARALFALDAPRFEALIVHWPHDIRYHVNSLAAKAFSVGAGDGQAR